MDDGADTNLGSVVDAVAEREEGVGGHDRAGNLQAGMLGLDGSDASGVDAAHLACADTDGLTALGVDNGVGFDELGDFPGEDQIVDFLLGRRAFGHHFQVVGGNHADITALHQQATVDALVVPVGLAVGTPFAALEQANVGFGGDGGAGLSADARGDDYLNKLTFNDGGGSVAVQLTVEGDDAAEGGFAVGCPGQVIGLADAAFIFRHNGNAARIGVLDDNAGRFGEALDAFQRGVGVCNVVVGQLFALQLGGGGDAGLGRCCFLVEGGGLVRVFAVAHVLHFDELAVEGAREGGAVFCAQGVAGLLDGTQVVGNHAVVGRSVLERLQGQIKALGVGQATALERVEDAAVVAGVDHDGNVFVVLGGAADHGRAADVDVLDGVRQGAAGLCYRSGEGVEIDYDHVDGLDAMLGHNGAVDVTATQDAAVDFRVQGLDPAVHHFREAGVVSDFNGLDALLAEQLVGAAGGEDFNALGAQLAGKIDDTGFVRNADQRAAYRQAGSLVGHLGSRLGGCGVESFMIGLG